MVMMRWNRVTLAVLTGLLALAPAVPEALAQGPRGFGRPAVPGPDDVPAFPDPPAGFDVRREDVPHGRLEMVTYDSKSVGTERKMQVYTPPGYSNNTKYPVLYLLLGISQGMHAYLKEHDVPHVWTVDSNGHDATHWRNNLYHFVQRIFTEDGQAAERAAGTAGSSNVVLAVDQQGPIIKDVYAGPCERSLP